MNDLAQQLQDIHLSNAPSWWPPAPGWWFLAALLLTGCFLLFRLVVHIRNKRKPLNQARKLHTRVYADHLAGTISKVQYVDTCNQLLKRLLLTKNRNKEITTAFGEPWLALLDVEFSTNEFTCGAGEILGSSRYRDQFDPDCQNFQALMHSSLQGFKP